MGAYASAPVRDKVSADDANERLRYGASSMQGWRINQEDAHNCCLDFDLEHGTTLFGVYDGHGGAEVAQYMAQSFPGFLKTIATYREGNLSQALEDAFLGFDATLTTPQVIQRLREIAGVDPDEGDDENEEDTNALFEEADMPLEKLMERYTSSLSRCSGQKAQKQRQQSKQQQQENLNEPEAASEIPSSENGAENDSGIVSSSSDGGGSGEKEAAGKERLETRDSLPDAPLVNGEEEEMKDREGREGEDGESGGVKKGIVVNGHEEITTGDEVLAGAKWVGCGEGGSKGEARVADSSTATSATCIEEDCAKKEVAKEVEMEENAEPSSSTGRKHSARKGIIPEEGEDETSAEDSEEGSSEEEEWKAENEKAEDGEDGDEDEWEDVDEDEESDEEDGEEEEGTEEADGPIVTGGEEPGSDSGCTAVVALVCGNQLFVANAGDSRCVVCRAGRALDMSIDHKPETKEERERIVKAGGRVTLDGRVNGGLNLSRAIGDHVYKKNATLPAKEQMITALPDVRSITLQDEDEFMVLACDGIWNVMTSEDVVSFVREHIASRVDKLSAVCEDMFEFCLAPDTFGDGTGCDNMTAIVVEFKRAARKGTNHTGSNAASTIKIGGACDSTVDNGGGGAADVKGGKVAARVNKRPIEMQQEENEIEENVAKKAKYEDGNGQEEGEEKNGEKSCLVAGVSEET